MLHPTSRTDIMLLLFKHAQLWMTGMKFLSQFVTVSWCKTTHKPLQNPRKNQKFRLTVGLSRQIKNQYHRMVKGYSYLDCLHCWQHFAHQEGNIYSCRDTALRAALGLLCCKLCFRHTDCSHCIGAVSFHFSNCTSQCQAIQYSFFFVKERSCDSAVYSCCTPAKGTYIFFPLTMHSFSL